MASPSFGGAGGAAAGQGTPAPCTICGAPMSVSAPQFLHQDPELVCQYCGRRETLPKDASELHRHLRLRLLQVAQAREASEAPLRTFQMMNDRWPMALLFTGGIGLFQGYSFWSSWRALGHVEVGSVLGGALPLACAVGMLCGWLGMRHVYSARLKPLLRARPPQAPGLAARCRNCGGDLPRVAAPQIICVHCSATNLLDGSLTANAAALLQQEAQAYHERLRPWARDGQAYLAPVRAFYLWGGVGAFLALLVGCALFYLLLSAT